jgi:membrane associated rhomboid family serine protease
MLPISDEDQAGRRHPPYVTWAILIINVLVFLYEVMLGSRLDPFISTYGAVPREILTGQDLPPPGPYPLYLQLLTSMFLHGGWLHLIGNMAYLRVFGDDIEDALGPIFYLLFYLGAGLVASLTQILISGPSGPGSTVPSVGASGAIAGILGAYLVLFPQRRVHVLVPTYFFSTARVSALVMLGFWFVLQFLNGIAALTGGTAETGGVAVWAHVGGFVAGAIVGLLLRGGISVRQGAFSR